MIYCRIIKAMSVRARLLKGILKVQIHEAENICYLWSPYTGHPRPPAPYKTPARPFTRPQGRPGPPTCPRTRPQGPPCPPTRPRTRWQNNWPWKSLALQAILQPPDSPVFLPDSPHQLLLLSPGQALARNFDYQRT